MSSLAPADFDKLPPFEQLTHLLARGWPVTSTAWGFSLTLSHVPDSLCALIVTGKIGDDNLKTLTTAHDKLPPAPAFGRSGTRVRVYRVPEGVRLPSSSDLFGQVPGIEVVCSGALPLPPSVDDHIALRWYPHGHPAKVDVVDLPAWLVTLATDAAAAKVAGARCATARGEMQERETAETARMMGETAPISAQHRLSFDRGDSVELAQVLIEQLRALAPDAGSNGCDAVVFDRGSLWHYDPHYGIYLEHDRAAVYRLVSAFAGAPTGPKGKPLSLSDGAIKGAVYAAQQLATRKGFFDSAAKGTVFADCFVSARAGVVVREVHSHLHRATHALSVTYEAGGCIDRWLSMLREVLRRRDEHGVSTEETDSDTEDCIALLQEWVGVALMGEATSRAQSLVLVGTGNDGKSSILNVLRALFPPTSVCSIAPQDWARGFLLAGLAGKRLNVVAELPERDILDSERFKAVVDGSPLTAERKNQDPFDLVCEAAHLFACNALPATRDQSKGFWRRFIVLLCERSFEAHEVVRDLWKTIVAEELAGIAAWALEGAARAQGRQSFTMPVSSSEAKADWQHESDQVRQFVGEACVPTTVTAASEEASLVDLFVAYRLWCAQSGHPPMARNRLGARLRGLGYEHRTKLARLYKLRVSAAWLASARADTAGSSRGGVPREAFN